MAKKKKQSVTTKKEADFSEKENVRTMIDEPQEVTELKQVQTYKLNTNIKCNGVHYKKGFEFNGFHQNFNIFKDFI